MSIEVFIKSNGNEIVEVSVEQHILENEIITINTFKDVKWEHCDIQHCFQRLEDGTCLTVDGSPCSEEHKFGES